MEGVVCWWRPHRIAVWPGRTAQPLLHPRSRHRVVRRAIGSSAQCLVAGAGSRLAGHAVPGRHRPLAARQNPVHRRHGQPIGRSAGRLAVRGGDGPGAWLRQPNADPVGGRQPARAGGGTGVCPDRAGQHLGLAGPGTPVADGPVAHRWWQRPGPAGPDRHRDRKSVV